MNRTRNNIRVNGLLARICAVACICFVAAVGLVQPASAETATAETKAVDTSREFEKTGEVKSAVRTGNDPRDFGHKVTPYWRHDDRKGGITTDDAYLFFMVPFTFPGTRVPSAFTFESPLYRWKELDDAENQDGVADWTMRLILKPFITPWIFGTKASHVFFMETTVPTGEKGITSDQTLLSPGYGPIMSNSPNWFFAPIFFYDYGLVNRSNADRTKRLRGRIFYQYAWKNGIYILPETQVIWDFSDDDNTSFTANLLPEIGWVWKKPPKLTSSYRPSAPPGGALYIKGGPGISNDGTGDLNYRLEIGHRFLW